ncbi:MAG: hypothetical protein JWN03_7871 [Nocardia sp.]|nr:hypothetical protein [Nocardia sp.]
MKIIGRALCVLGVVVTALWVGVASAAAHAVLVGSDPAYGATVQHAPEWVSLTFDEPVTAAQHAVTVADRDGVRADTGGVTTADGGRTVVVPLRSGLPDGTYLLGWSLLSADGHVVAGSIVFGIGTPPDLSLTAAPPDPLVAALDTVVRLLTGLGYTGVALAVGVPLAARLVWREGLRGRGILQLTRIGAVAVVVASLLIFAATPGRLAGAAGWGEPHVWVQSATSILGTAALVRAAAAVLLAIGWWYWAQSSHDSGAPLSGIRRNQVERGQCGSRPKACRDDGGRYRAYKVSGWVPAGWGQWPPVIAVAAGAVVAATAVSGHAVAGEYRWAAVGSTVLHLVGMSVWVGGVAIVLLVWRTPGRAAVVRRFGPVAAGAVALVVVTGIFQSWRAVSPLAALWSTSWGLLLLLKLALVGAAAGTALVARRVSRSEVPASSDMRRHKRSGALLRIEFGVQVAVLVVSALLTGVAPARETYDPATALNAQLGPLSAAVAVDGAHTGRQEFTVHLRDSQGVPAGALELSARLVRGDGRIGSIEVPFRRVEPVELGPDYFVSQPVQVPLAGDWQLRLTVAVDRTNAYAATLPYRVW